MAGIAECEQARRKLLSYQNSQVNDADAVSELLSFLQFPSLVSLVGEVTATLAREETFRDAASKSQLPENLIKFLSESDLNTRLQILRASGNLSIDHDINREKLLDANICRSVTTLLSKCSDSCEEGNSNQRYKLVLCGCLLNLSASANNSKLADSFIKCGALESLAKLLCSEQDCPIRDMGLKALSALCESGEVINADVTSLTKLLAELATSSEMTEPLIEIIESIVKKDDERILLQLVDEGLVRHLLDRQDKYFQKSIDIVVLILGNDKCMAKLYESGTVLLKAKEWLQSSEQRHLANAAIIVANFARSDRNCTDLFKSGYIQLLLPLTEIEEIKEYEGKLHFAALSALRNFSIPSELRLDLFSMGVADVAIHCLKNSSFPHIHFKSLGILRLLIQKQSSICSSVAKAAMGQIISATQNTSTSHVHIEAGRLLAGIMKYCSEKDIRDEVVQSGGLDLIYDLVHSTEPVLVGEGLIAMNIIACIPDEKTFSTLIKTIKETFTSVICSKLNSKSSLDILNNSMVLLSTIFSKDSEIKESLLSNISFQEAVQELLSHDNDVIQSKARDLKSLLTT